MRRVFALMALIVAGPAMGEPELPAERIVLGLSSDRVAITATFDGSSILVFGAVRRDAPPPVGAPLEVAVAVSGPLRRLTVRRSERVGPIWANAEAAEVDAAPSFYAIATTAPFDQVLSETEDLRHAVSLRRAIRAVGTGVAEPEAFLDALIRIRAREGIYQVIPGGVDLEADTLFRTRIDLPANLVEGDYKARIFLTRGGRVVDSYETDIRVLKVGIERWLFALSVDSPLLYGLLALALAIAAGWGAQALFDRSRG